MKQSSSFKSFILSLGIIVVMSGCVYDPYYHGAGPGPYYPHYYPYYYDYYYYPGVRVYFQFSTGFYFYFSNNRWIRTKVLPPHIHLDPRDRVTIRVESDKPYLKNREHVEKYQPRRPQAPVSRPQPPESRTQPPVSRPQPPVSRPQPPVLEKERENNLKMYQEHQKKQQDYEKEWEKRGNKDRRP